MKTTALVVLGGLLAGLAGCAADTQHHDDYYYEVDSMGREVVRPETNENWRDHEKERERQFEWDRERGVLDPNIDYDTHVEPVKEDF